MIRFSTLDLMDEPKCYVYLVAILHPEGLGCPACHTPVAHAKVHRRDRAPLLSFRCACGRIYNALNADEKGRLHPDPEDPPCRRANHARYLDLEHWSASRPGDCRP